MTSSKIFIKDFLTKLIHNVDSSILNYLGKFQIDISKLARVPADQSVQNLCTVIFQQQKPIIDKFLAAAMLVGKRMPNNPFSHIK